MQRVFSSLIPSRLSAVLAVALVSPACSGDAGGPLVAPSGPTGSIEITTSTTGWNRDSDGYLARVEGASGTLPVDGTTTISGVPVGSRAVSIEGLAANCTVGGSNPTSVQILEGVTASVNFVVSCALTHLENQLVYSAWIGNEYDLFAADPDGGRPIRLMSHPGFEDYARVSPDGRSVLVRGLSGGVADIYSIAADGSGATNLTNDPAQLDEHAAWSPDGARIAFERRVPSSQSKIYIMNADGSGQQDITVGTDGGRPDWSPDGTKIVFTSYRAAVGEIYVMDADGSNVIRLTHASGGDTWPRWSPDGTQIAFTSSRDGNREVYVMNADGSNQVNLTQHPADDESPVWSPDGLQLTFGSGRGGGYGTWIMNADGTQPTALLNGVVVEDWAR